MRPCAFVLQAAQLPDKNGYTGYTHTVKIPPEPRSHQCPWLSMIFFHPCSCKEEANEEKKARTRGGIRRSLSNPGTHLLFPSVKREEWGGTSNTKREERNWETSSWKEDEGEEKDNDEIWWKWTNLIEEDPRQERVWSRNSVRTFAEVLQRMSFISFGSGMNHWKFTTLEVPKKAPD